MGFKEWISHFENVDRPIGDLASDIARDEEFPSQNDKEAIKEHLSGKARFNVVADVLDAFENAWQFYQMDTRR